MTDIRSSLVGILTEVILESISLPDISLYTLLLLRDTLEMAGVSRWLDSLAAAESLLAVLTTLGGHCSLQMDHRMVVAPLGGEDMVDLVVPVTGLLEVRLGLIVNTLASSSTQQLIHSSIHTLTHYTH